ncbi:MAG: YggT family protein [Clostridia bacterium]
MENKKDLNEQNNESSTASQEAYSVRNNTGAASYEEEHWHIQTRNIIYYILSVIEALLVFRLLFKLLGANANNGFVSLIYSLTQILTAPFSGIFQTGVTNTDGTQFVFEPAVIIAMIVYAIIARGLASLTKLKTSGNARK